MGGGIQQSGKYGSHIKAPVEAVLHFRQVAVGIFFKIERMARAGNGCFQVAQNLVDPVETPHVGAFSSLAYNLRLVIASASCYRPKAWQAVGNHN